MSALDRDALLELLASSYFSLFNVSHKADRILALVEPDPRIDAVRALHRQGGVAAASAGYPQGWCLHDNHSWPCPTIRVLDGTR